MDAAVVTRSLRRTLIVGGVLLIGGAVIGFAQPWFLGSVMSPIVGWMGIAAFSAALLVFAFGLGRGGSIVARRPLGVAAAVVVAVWPVVQRIVTAFVPFEDATREFHQVWGYVTLAVTLGGLIAFTVEIARAGVVRGRLRWAPLWGLVALAVPQVIAQVLIAAVGADLGTSDDHPVFLVLGLGQLLTFAVPVTLGILALLHANGPAARHDAQVQVYPPPTA